MSAISALPSELLSAIFLLTLPPLSPFSQPLPLRDPTTRYARDKHRTLLNNLDAPWTLPLVSSDWRYTALSLPGLWTRFFLSSSLTSFEGRILHLQLARIKAFGSDTPMDVLIRFTSTTGHSYRERTKTPFAPLLDALVEMRSRWRTVEWFFDDGIIALPPILVSPAELQTLPNLVELRIMGTRPMSLDLLEFFQNAPRLTRVSLGDPNANASGWRSRGFEHVVLPWSQLMAYKSFVERLDPHLARLTLCASTLRVLDLHSARKWYLAPMSRSLKLELPVLEALVLSLGEAASGLGCFTAPQLAHLHISELRDADGRELHAFLRRANSTINMRSLTLTTLSSSALTASTIIDILRETPRLGTLRLCMGTPPTADSNPVNDAPQNAILHAVLDSSHFLLRELQHLEWADFADQTDRRLLVDFVIGAVSLRLVRVITHRMRMKSYGRRLRELGESEGGRRIEFSAMGSYKGRKIVRDWREYFS
uniref:F-box domain-containing protein n=1 Tax=Mycena chlorophos TaxID=658473 RepID=A0ABQ0KUY7_MYCCL|nr:predicted protein [Mycena chlorophos]